MNARRLLLTAALPVFLLLANAFGQSPGDDASENVPAASRSKSSTADEETSDKLIAELREIEKQRLEWDLRFQRQGAPRLALRGYCPVTLVEERRWERGDSKHWAISSGQSYYMVSASKKHKFEQSPEKYAPVLGGSDPVVWLEEGHRVRGTCQHGVFFQGQVVLFRDEASLKRFQKTPTLYLPQYDSVRLPALPETSSRHESTGGRNTREMVAPATLPSAKETQK